MSFFIEKEVECNFNFDYEKVAEAVVSASLEHESFPYEAEVNLTLTDNEGIHAINKEYRQPGPLRSDPGRIPFPPRTIKSIVCSFKNRPLSVFEAVSPSRITGGGSPY